MDRIEALWRRCRTGDPDAIEELVRRWERKVFYYVRRLVPQEEDAWDVLQITWVRVIRSVGKVRDADALVPWIYRIARNAAITHRQSLLSREAWIDDAAAVDQLAPDEPIEPRWSAEEVHRGMEQLSAHHRDALALFFLEAFSIEQMASILQVSEGTVKSRLFYAKKALRDELEKSRSYR
jgi:RNA polymerase sigma-70 factor (ECF subfamily)